LEEFVINRKLKTLHQRAQIVNAAVTEDKSFHLDVEFADGAKKRTANE
jgi:hypothetical protein